MSAATGPAPVEAPPAPGPKWCGTVLSCLCGNKLTVARTVQLPEQKALRCGNCKVLIDAKAIAAIA